MPTRWRSTSAMIFCAWSLLANAAAALRLPSLQTCGSHSDGWMCFGPGDDRGEVAVEHLEVHAVVRHCVGREKGLELVQLGFGQRFVQCAGIGHCGPSRDATSELCIIPRSPDWRYRRPSTKQFGRSMAYRNACATLSAAAKDEHRARLMQRRQWQWNDVDERGDSEGDLDEDERKRAGARPTARGAESRPPSGASTTARARRTR